MAGGQIPAGCLWQILGPDRVKGRGHVLCRCLGDGCGTLRTVWVYDIYNGKSLSCGCHRKALLTTHGRSGKRDPTYNSWGNMIGRCTNPKATGYANYGGRGITVCDRWQGEQGFANFLTDMGERPGSNYTIDRKDNDGNYEPSNCRWASKKDQARNQRDNVNLTHNGRTQCLSAWAEELGMSRMVLDARRSLGWDDTKTLTTPVHPYKERNDKAGSTLTHNGKTQRISAWSKELGIPVQTIYSRIKQGWPVERILGTYTSDKGRR